MADLKRQVSDFFFFFLLPWGFFFLSFSFFFFTSQRRETDYLSPSLCSSSSSLFSLSLSLSLSYCLSLSLPLFPARQIAARGYASGSFDLPPRSQRLCLAGRALGDDAATLAGLGLAEAFVEQVAGFVVFDTEEDEGEGKEGEVVEKKKQKET